MITLEPERADTPDAMMLIQELEDVLDPLYPNESRHGYGVEKMLREGVHFFVLRVDGAPAACGGVQFYDSVASVNGDSPEPAYGELKRMYVRPTYRGCGYAKRMLEFLAQYAQTQNVYTLRLETGILQKEAISLYEGWGFERIQHFGAYKADPLSIFYEKRLPKLASVASNSK